MAPHLGHDEFFKSLAELLSKTSQQVHGSVNLTQKPLINVPGATTTNSQPSILIRATDGNTNAPNLKNESKETRIAKKRSQKIKLSTIVNPDDIEAFYVRYAEVCKTGMSGLKKRDRRARKAKTKGGAAKVTKA
ncbi:Signal recognition particle SRP14 subunit [Penicillium concentricum]|uniref:Signal recognition particle subunit SRP14 n=1 Tax=Penicillium concentricum TaxID=293559 RepID=A0A9W9SA67_9EURO|nr:Signal recognition particle SRP14 subunit [Penicillium concentricum]KAJ5372433.1 Signal recognition particle SRP14 subunit [Penicillium concentricum]